MANAGAKLSSFPEVNDIQAGDMFPLLSDGNTNAKIDYATLANAIIAKEVERATAAENKLESEKANKTNATSSADGLMSKTDKAKLDGIDPSAITTNAANIKKNADAISVRASLIPTGKEIYAGDDLNNNSYTAVGTYYCSAIVEAQHISNLPEVTAFMMTVYNPLGPLTGPLSTPRQYRLQEFMPYHGAQKYIRMVSTDGESNVTFGDWVKIANSYDLAAVSNTINDHIANKSNPHAVTKAQVGLGSVANIDQSKAIKSITRSGTTFTATALDGTTTTFTQQDNDTTYSVATTSANGLMSAADKKAIDREFFRMLPKDGTYIPANADLNSVEYLKVGSYYNPSIGESSTIKNMPINSAFMMYVLSPLSEVYDNEESSQWVCRLRIFVGYNGLIYTQFINSEATAGVFLYYPWSKLATDADVSPIKTVKVNGTALTPDSNKAVNVTVPTLANNATTTAGGMALDARMGKTLADQASQLAKNTAQIESAGTATNAHSAGEYVMISNALYKVTASVAKGDTWTIGTNVAAANVGSEISSLKSDLANKLYPVGSIYMSVNATNPSELFGGTWEQLKDRFLLAAGDTYAAGSTGGEAQHTLTVDEMPSHGHEYDHLWTISPGNRQLQNGNAGYSLTFHKDSTSGLTGGGQAHNNMPPYLAVYMWKRIA